MAKKNVKKKSKPPKKTRSATKGRANVPKELPNDIKSLIRLLSKAWPGTKSKEITRLFKAINTATVKPEAKPEAAPARPEVRTAAPASFNMMDMLRRTLSAHDLLFLRKQITYHIAASAHLPTVFADADRVQAATASLLEYMAMHAPRGSQIGVQLKEIPLRSGNGIEVAFVGNDDSLHSIEKTSFVHRMYEAESEDGMVLVNCRELVSSQGGQMWADLPKPRCPVYRMVLPTFEGARETDKPLQMFKYDISISNYPNVRKRFGIKKSLMLVGQIEMYVRALVRHPIDVVTAAKEKGIITTIYESPKGAAQSVASRISQRLGAEEFRIGKKTVELSFRYNLSQLPSSNSRGASASKGSLSP